jgi:hypothetical protein
MSDLLLEVRVLGGAHVRDAIGQMCRLADNLGITVAANCNDVRVVAPPHSDDYALYLNWERERDRAEKETRSEPTVEGALKELRQRVGLEMPVVSVVNECGCYNCSDFARRMSVMITCPECGNKRCPKATHHIHACTKSNAPGQPGSRYYEDVEFPSSAGNR